jgi:hypothetical protein
MPVRNMTSTINSPTIPALIGSLILTSKDLDDVTDQDEAQNKTAYRHPVCDGIEGYLPCQGHLAGFIEVIPVLDQIVTDKIKKTDTYKARNDIDQALHRFGEFYDKKIDENVAPHPRSDGKGETDGHCSAQTNYLECTDNRPVEEVAQEHVTNCE